MSSNFNTDFTFEYYKCREVKSPAKFGAAAGWDFFIPDDLTIFDFANNIGVYINEFVEISGIHVNTPDVKSIYILPLEFNIKNKDGKIETWLIVIHEKVDGELKTIFNRKPEVHGVAFLNNKPSDAELETLLTVPVESIKILPGGKVLIPSGIHVKLPEQVFLVGENKSGIASKRGLIKAAQVIDQDYQGQIHINMINPTANSVYIKPGEKIIQFVPYFQPIMTKVKEYDSKEDLYKNSESVRGEGGFGSSGIR